MPLIISGDAVKVFAFDANINYSSGIFLEGCHHTNTARKAVFTGRLETCWTNRKHSEEVIQLCALKSLDNLQFMIWLVLHSLEIAHFYA